MTERPTTWVGLWLQAVLVGDRVRAKKLTTRLNSGNPKGWTLDEPAVVRAAFDLGMNRYFSSRDDPLEIEAFAARLKEELGGRSSTIDVGVVARQIGQSLRGEGRRADAPSVAVAQRIHLVALKLATMKLAMTKREISSLICQAEDLARSRGWNPPPGP
jgi:hypothetical protein